MGRDQAGGGTWGRRAKKQGRSCKALNVWVWRRCDEKDGGKGGPWERQPQTSVLTAQLDATGRKAILRKPQALSLPRARLFPDTSSWTPKMLGHCGWDSTPVGAGNFQVHSPPPHPTRMN